MQLSDIVIVAAIAGVANVAATIGGVMVSWIGRRKIEGKIDAADVKIEAVRVATDGLVAQGRRDSKDIGEAKGHAEGLAVGKLMGRDEEQKKAADSRHGGLGRR